MIKIFSQRVRDLEKNINGIVFYAYDNAYKNGKTANVGLDLESSLDPRRIMQALLNLIMILYDLDYIPSVQEIRIIEND